MLIQLATIHQPHSLQDAAALLEHPDTRALYGGATVRENSPLVTTAIDLRQLGLNKIQIVDGELIIGSTTTLETVRAFCLEQNGRITEALAAALMIEFPYTLRNVMTPGDILSEARPNSLLLTLFAALGSRTHVERHGKLFVSRRIRLDQAEDSAGFALEKVARTPADAPIVGAVAWIEGNSERVAVCGIAPQPVVYTFGMESTVADHLGSAEYRTEMAKVVARRALEKAAIMAGRIGRE